MTSWSHRRADRAGRRVRQRQVDADEHPGRPRLPHRGSRPRGRARPGVHVLAAAAGLPAVRGRVHLAADGAEPAPLPDRDAERRAAAPARRDGPPHPPQARGRAARAAQRRALRRAAARPDVRRRAAAGLDRGGAVELAVRAAGRRADGRARQRDRRVGLRRAADGQLRARRDRARGDPRPGRVLDGRKDDRDQGRPDRDGDAQARLGRRLGRVRARGRVRGPRPGRAASASPGDDRGPRHARPRPPGGGTRPHRRVAGPAAAPRPSPTSPTCPTSEPGPSPSPRTVPRERPSQRRPVGVPVDGRARHHGRRAGRHPHLRQRPDRDRRPPRRHLLHRRGKAGRAPRPVRLRQDHPAQRRGRPRLPQRRHGPRGRPGRDRHGRAGPDAAAPGDRGLYLPVVRPAAGALGGGERRRAAADRRRRARASGRSGWR